MSVLAEKIAADDATYESSREAIDVVRELERRRVLAVRDASRLRDGDSHLQSLIESRRHV